MKRFYQLQEIVELGKVDRDFVLLCLHKHWIMPYNPTEVQFDDEDLARIHLIQDLLNDFEVNDEGVSIILHLLDQLHSMRKRLDQLAG